jgi:secondary thiamine-phosphate synthase enzyme
MGTPQWFQHEISITAPSRGCHLVTDNIQKAIGSDLSNIKIGMANVFIQHTSASLTINENADPSVRTDMETALNRLVPASWNHDGTFTHTMEGEKIANGNGKTRGRLPLSLVFKKSLTPLHYFANSFKT